MENEKRLIDANALKESVMKEIRHYWNKGEGGYYLAEDVIPDIDLAPTVDAITVEELEQILSTAPGLGLWDYQKRGIMNAVKRICGKESDNG